MIGDRYAIQTLVPNTTSAIASSTHGAHSDEMNHSLKAPMKKSNNLWLELNPRKCITQSLFPNCNDETQTTFSTAQSHCRTPMSPHTRKSILKCNFSGRASLHASHTNGQCLAPYSYVLNFGSSNGNGLAARCGNTCTNTSAATQPPSTLSAKLSTLANVSIGKVAIPKPHSPLQGGQQDRPTKCSAAT